MLAPEQRQDSSSLKQLKSEPNKSRGQSWRQAKLQIKTCQTFPREKEKFQRKLFK